MVHLDYFLKLDGIDGESADSKHKGAIDLVSRKKHRSPGRHKPQPGTAGAKDDDTAIPRHRAPVEALGSRTAWARGNVAVRIAVICVSAGLGWPRDALSIAESTGEGAYLCCVARGQGAERRYRGY